MIRSAKCVVVATGVNDIDTKDAEDILASLKVGVDLLRHRYENPKIVIAEIIPRTDERDEEVKKCNTLIKEFVDQDETLFIGDHSRLRTEDGRHHQDAKHITQYSTALFVANIKRPLRKALGINKWDGYEYRSTHTEGLDGVYGYGGRGRGRGRDRGSGRGYGDRRGRGGHGRLGHGWPDRGGAFNMRNEFEKFKLELLNIVNNIR